MLLVSLFVHALTGLVTLHVSARDMMIEDFASTWCFLVLYLWPSLFYAISSWAPTWSVSLGGRSRSPSLPFRFF